MAQLFPGPDQDFFEAFAATLGCTWSEPREVADVTEYACHEPKGKTYELKRWEGSEVLSTSYVNPYEGQSIALSRVTARD